VAQAALLRRPGGRPGLPHPDLRRADAAAHGAHRHRRGQRQAAGRLRPLAHARRRLLDDLHAAGVAPERVDVVVCTHLHVDHVGWNTRLVGGRWVPTFPNATYLFTGEEWEYWRHEKDACIADSVEPVVAAGQARLVDSDHAIDPWLRFEPSPGHTPGHVCLRLSTGAGEAVFAGDLMHRTVQVAEPQWSSRFCYDPKRAAATRRAFVERHADTGTLILPAHFPRAGYIVREDGGHHFVPTA
jgi:glyoxylase-like metal-dependent hydrolase (beta-lactamase superfamily II)